MSGASPSLLTRLRGQFLLLGAVPVLAVFAVAWALLAPLLLEQAEVRNSELAWAVRDQVHLQLDQRLGAAAVLADRLRDDPPASEALQRSLQALVLRDPFLQAAYVTDARGQVVNAALGARSGRFAEDMVGLDLSGQPYFAEARQRGQPVWSDTFLSTLTGQVTVALAFPADERTILFELSLGALSQSVNELSQAGSSLVVIVDRAGRIVAHPEVHRALRQESLSNLPVVQAALSGTEARARTVSEGVQVLAYATPVQPVGWAVVTSRPVSAVMAPVLRLGAAVVGVLIATVLLAVWVGWRMARRTGQEVAQLAEGAQLAVDEGGSPPALSFSTQEFNAVWTRLRDLFQQLHARDVQTRAAQRDLQAVLDAATQVAIFATDKAGTVTVFNIGAQRMLGWTSAEVVGTLLPTVWHDETEVATRAQTLSLKYGQTVTGVETLLAEARRGGYEVRDWVFVRRDGQRLDVSLAVTAMRTPEGDLKGFLGVAVDITERRRAAELELARKTADLASQAKSDFLSRMSHELRTPLNAILGFAQLIEADEEAPQTPRQREHMRHIRDAGWYLVRLIDDVLDLARIESGRIGVNIVALDIQPVLQNAERLVQEQMRQHGVSLAVTSSSEAQGQALRVLADETRLSQVLVNLLGNAAKYNRRQGKVQLDAQRTGDEVRLTVSDTGIGMTPAQLSHLYEPFNRLGQERSPIEGTGIGLVITRHLVEMMAGRIEVHSTPGEGTQFIVTLPAADEHLPAQLSGPGRHAASLPGTGSGSGRVVYIEDNDVNALLMRAVLRQRPQVSLQVFDRADSGLAAVRAEPPDLILLDMHLPDASGEQVLASLRADEQLRGIPVVVVSADATQARAAEVLEQGARAYLTKPLNLAETLEIIDRLLSGGSSAPGTGWPAG